MGGVTVAAHAEAPRAVRARGSSGAPHIDDGIHPHDVSPG
jgi:hypothetical protein